MNNEPSEIIKPRGGKRKPLPPVEFIRECLRYDKVSGSLTWNVRPLHHFKSVAAMNGWNARFGNTEAGSRFVRNDGSHRYIEIGLRMGRDGGNTLYQAGLLIMALERVEIPYGMEVDHKDRDNWNNRWENLRIGTPRQNVCNRAIKNKKGGFPKGVFRNGKERFGAAIRSNGKQIFLGNFATTDEAHKAYCNAAKRYHGEFASFD